MSTGPVVPDPNKPSTVDSILALVDGILGLAGSVIPGGQLADALVKIVQKGVSAYEVHVGAPIDSSLIKPEAPIEEKPPTG